MEISKESQRIKIRTYKRRFGKFVTTVAGIQGKENIKEIEKLLKRKLACGGTVKSDEIELQGDHKRRAKVILLEEGYKKELIED